MQITKWYSGYDHFPCASQFSIWLVRKKTKGGWCRTLCVEESIHRLCNSLFQFLILWNFITWFTSCYRNAVSRSDHLIVWDIYYTTLQWCNSERDGVPNHRHRKCLLKRLFRRRSKKTSKLRVTGLCDGNPPATSGFPSQRASYAENVSNRWRHHDERIVVQIANYRFVIRHAAEIIAAETPAKLLVNENF